MGRVSNRQLNQPLAYIASRGLAEGWHGGEYLQDG